MYLEIILNKVVKLDITININLLFFKVEHFALTFIYAVAYSRTIHHDSKQEWQRKTWLVELDRGLGYLNATRFNFESCVGIQLYRVFLVFVQYPLLLVTTTVLTMSKLIR